MERIKSKNASSSETIIDDINERILGLINSCNNQLNKSKERLGHIRGTNSSFSLYIEGVESRFDILVKLLPKEMKHFEYKKYNGVDTDEILSDILKELSMTKFKVNLNQYRSFIAKEFYNLKKNIQLMNISSDSPILYNLLRFRSFDSYSVYINPPTFSISMHHMDFLEREKLLFKFIVDANQKIIENLGILLSYQESLQYKEIRGRADFVFKDKIIEIKQTSKKSISENDLLQIFLYALISRTKNYQHLNSINSISLYFPLYNQIFNYNIDELLKKIPSTPENFLNELISFVDHQSSKKTS